MLKALAILALVGAMLLPVVAASADEGGQDHPAQLGALQAEPITVGTVAGTDNGQPAVEIRESGSNRE